jgi:hypothetical protein
MFFLIAGLLGVSLHTASYIVTLLWSATLVASVLTGMGFASFLISAVLAYPKWYTRTQLIVW